MPLLDKNLFVLVVKLALLFWGIENMLQGLGLSFFVYGNNQYMQTSFIGLVYASVLLAVLVSFLSNRIAIVILCCSTVAALAILWRTKAFGLGVSTAESLVGTIAMRPILALGVLLLLSLCGQRSLSRR